MSASGLEVFDDTVHKTNLWLKEIMEALGPDRQRAYHALRAVLHSLRDRLTVDEAAHLSAQLPMLIRGIYFEGWHPAHKPTKARTREAFLAEVEERLQGIGPINPATATQAVLAVLERNIDPGEAAHIRQALPKPLQTLFP
jgi:uncharacterized protein (DUF2267 family)